MEDTVTIRGDVIADTDLAVLFRLNGGGQEVWIPRSVMDPDDLERGDEGVEVEVAEWFADKEGL